MQPKQRDTLIGINIERNSLSVWFNGLLALISKLSNQKKRTP